MKLSLGHWVLDCADGVQNELTLHVHAGFHATQRASVYQWYFERDVVY